MLLILSLYIRRNQRGKGIGKALLFKIEKEAVKSQIHKIVLKLPFQVTQANKLGIIF
ncbi:GNAT family N-acetyltransferase [Bacillus safensis]|uniref:GNAT family N-acetyltransferase n=1 Tax=Bacillus safensis TaxID=561879 RepID=UPI00321587DA